ncbi:MAG: hypothetical protein ACQES2_02970 [Pseudomonadota bacterium]
MLFLKYISVVFVATFLCVFLTNFVSGGFSGLSGDVGVEGAVLLLVLFGFLFSLVSFFGFLFSVLIGDVFSLPFPSIWVVFFSAVLASVAISWVGMVGDGELSRFVLYGTPIATLVYCASALLQKIFGWLRVRFS